MYMTTANLAFDVYKVTLWSTPGVHNDIVSDPNSTNILYFSIMTFKTNMKTQAFTGKFIPMNDIPIGIYCAFTGECARNTMYMENWDWHTSDCCIYTAVLR